MDTNQAKEEIKYLGKFNPRELSQELQELIKIGFDTRVSKKDLYDYLRKVQGYKVSFRQIENEYRRLKFLTIQ